MDNNNLKGLGVILFTLLVFLTIDVPRLFPQTPSTESVPKRIKFERLTIEQGIAQNSIFCTLQDKQGFLWLGTEGGLDRYDGYTFKTYEYEHGNPGSLSNNNVLALLEDSRGILWVGTHDGLNRLHRGKGSFRRFKHDPNNPGSISSNHINSVFEDDSKDLWIGTTGGGLNKYNFNTGTFTRYKPDKPGFAKPDNTSHLDIYSLYKDKGNRFWVGTGCGLYLFEPDSGTFSRVNLDDGLPNDKRHYEIRTIFQDEPGILWLGTTGRGLIRYDHKKRAYTSYQRGNHGPNGSSGLDSDNVRAIVQPKNDSGTLWIATFDSGLCRFDRETEGFVHYKKNRDARDSLSNNMVYSLCMDRTGILWIGTESGLNKFDERKSRFGHWAMERNNSNSLMDDNVWAIYKGRGNILWVGTNEGLEKIDWETGVFTHYKKGREPFSLSHNRVFAICEDRAGMIWAGTWGGGLNRLDPKTGNFKHYRHDPGKPGTLRDDHISSLLVDGAGVLWVGTKSGGLNQFQPGTGTFTAFSEGPDNTPGITGMRVTSIFEDRFGRLWVGTDNGLNLFDRKTGTFSHFRHDPQKDTGLSNDSISTIHADKSGTLWVGTYGGGLNKLPDPKTGIFQHYWKTREKKPNRPGNLQDRLPSNIINGILEDEEDNLWISTNHGLSKFNPAKESFRNYDIRDGLQSNEFHGGVCFKAKNGQMFFGGINGFNAFYPARLKIRSVPPPIVFTKFQVNGEPHEGESMEETRDIALDYRINYKNDSFAFEFAALDFSVPGKNKYEYKSEKLQSGWVRRDAKNRMVTFSNVSPGTYVFQVRGSNHEEVWNTTGASLKITILPPFWQTWWFRALVALLLLSVLFIGYRKRTRRLRQKLEEKERVQEILTQSNYEMEKVRDIAVIRNAENEILLTAISTIFVAVDSDGYIFQWNKSSEKFFKISREQALKHPFAYLLNDYIPEEKLKEIVRKGLKEQRPSKDITVNVDLGHGNGGNKLLLASISPVIDRTGKKLGFLLMAEDITNRKEEEDMQNLSKKLEALGQMASGIAHEIKTPLQYIGHNSRFVSDSFKDVMQVFETIEEGLREMENSDRPGVAKLIKDQMVRNDMDYIMEEIPKASSQIINGVEKVSEIIQSMTEYTYPGRGFKEKCDINELLKSTLVVVQNSIKRRADIHLNLDKDLPHVPCYPGELCQVFLNVLVNAGDAVEEKGEWGNISIYTGCEEENVLISITDTGVGIAENHRENIFTPFFTTKEVGKGTGQGLSLAHNVITENHNGKLEFTSKAGEGTTFYIRLPREIKGEH